MDNYCVVVWMIIGYLIYKYYIHIYFIIYCIFNKKLQMNTNIKMNNKFDDL